jgi:translation initiation factor 3 subunit J
MADNWDDGSDDDWDNDDDDLDARLGLKKVEAALPTFDDEEDLALKDKEAQDKVNAVELKKKGNAMVSKKQEEKDRKEELELAKLAMDMEAEAEQNLSPEELRDMKRRQIEEADHELTDDLFGTVDKMSGMNKPGAAGVAAAAGDKVVMKDIKDHLKHARKVAECIRGHGKIHLASAFLKELIQQSKDVLDDDAITEIIKTCNVIKNEKVQAAKRKVKGQAQKSKKTDKAAEMKARKLQVDTFGDNDYHDDVDQIGHDYEDAFF